MRHDGGGEPGKAAGTPTQRRPPRLFDQRGKARVGERQRRQRCLQIGFGVDVGRHAVRARDRRVFVSKGSNFGVIGLIEATAAVKLRMFEGAT